MRAGPPRTDTEHYLPKIALGEFVYLALRGRLGLPDPRGVAEEVVDEVRASWYLQLSHLAGIGWSTFLDLAEPELHDRLIVADALARDLSR